MRIELCNLRCTHECKAKHKTSFAGTFPCCFYYRNWMLCLKVMNRHRIGPLETKNLDTSYCQAQDEPFLKEYISSVPAPD